MAFWMPQVGQATKNSSPPGHEEREAKSEGKGSLLLVDVDFVNGLEFKGKFLTGKPHI